MLDDIQFGPLRYTDLIRVVVLCVTRTMSQAINRENARKKFGDCQMSSVSKELAAFVHEVKYDDIPPDVVHHVKNIILDAIGLGLSGIHTDEWKHTVAAVKDFLPGQDATVWGVGSKSSLVGATLPLICRRPLTAVSWYAALMVWPILLWS